MRIYVETSHTSRTGDRSGIPTVVRNLVAGLSERHEVVPLRWSAGKKCLTPLTTKWELNLDRAHTRKFHLPLASALNPRHWGLWMKTYGMDYKAPIHLHPAFEGELKGSWLILAELMIGAEATKAAAYAKEHGMRVAGIFYDAIPWLHPELVFTRTQQQHMDYMMVFAGLDVVIPISEHAGRDFLKFAAEKHLKPTVRACNLPGEIAGRPRGTELKNGAAEVVKILYVSTLEPRKNHLTLLDAFADARARLPGLKLELHLVGSSYKGAWEIADKVRATMAQNVGVFWHEKVGREALQQFYEDCDFTVYTSCIEGFGLPVMESLWFGRPCICADTGVIAENAEGGGCLAVDVRDRKALADGIVKLAGDAKLRQTLAEQALRRKVKTWVEYADGVVEILKTT